ncbi:MAG: hypothetical protein ABSF38_15915 [Verrucomicrobiota bacterium]|jgi:hypothetical protein
MNRRKLLILGALWAAIVGGSLLFLYDSGAGTPRLRLLGLTNSSNGAGIEVMLRFYNPAGHTVYLDGSTNGSPFFTREAKTPRGWHALDATARPSMVNTWGVRPGQSCEFSVPVMTNQREGWRVTVRYFDSAEVVSWSWLPGGIKLPWKGSGQYRTVSTDTLVQQQ